MNAKVSALLLLGGFAVSGCVPRTTAAPPPAAPVTPPITTLGLEAVMGSTARALVAQFGNPELDIREGTARKLQFAAPACVLDAYLYPRSGGEAVVTHVDARLPDGREMDRASCVAALSAARQSR